MIKQLLNSVIAKYSDLSVESASRSILRYVKKDVNCVANCQIIEQLTEKTWRLRLSCFC